jgi:Fe-S-cluster containining protein
VAEDSAVVVGRAFSLLNSIHKDLDYAETTLSYLLGGPVCVEQCGGQCCHQSLVITEISAQYMAANIKSVLPAERQGFITDRLRKWLLFNVPGVRLNFSNDTNDIETRLRQNEYEITGKLWCPLVDETGKCLIYPWRDVTCRAWGITRPPGGKCPRPAYPSETEQLRNYIGSGDPIVKEIGYQTAALKGLLREYLPQQLRKGWLPTLLYRILCPVEWLAIENMVQEIKIAQYEGVELLWILTKEEVDSYVKNTGLEDAIKIC